MKKIYKVFSLVFIALIALTLVSCKRRPTKEEKKFYEPYLSKSGVTNIKVMEFITFAVAPIIDLHEHGIAVAPDIPALVKGVLDEYNLFFELYPKEYKYVEEAGFKKRYEAPEDCHSLEAYHDAVELYLMRFKFVAENSQDEKERLRNAKKYNECASGKHSFYFELDRNALKNKLPRSIEYVPILN